MNYPGVPPPPFLVVCNKLEWKWGDWSYRYTTPPLGFWRFWEVASPHFFPLCLPRFFGWVCPHPHFRCYVPAHWEVICVLSLRIIKKVKVLNRTLNRSDYKHQVFIKRAEKLASFLASLYDNEKLKFITKSRLIYRQFC